METIRKRGISNIMNGPDLKTNPGYLVGVVRMNAMASKPKRIERAAAARHVFTLMLRARRTSSDAYQANLAWVQDLCDP
jgi:hypothetical protein